MLTRTMQPVTRWSDVGYHAAAVRQVQTSAYGGGQFGDKPEMSYISTPGWATMTMHCANPDGGFTAIPGGEPMPPPMAWRTW